MSLQELKNISQVSPVNKLVVNIFQHVMRNYFLYVQVAMYCFIYYIYTNEIPNYFTLILFCFERHNFFLAIIAMVIFAHVKITCHIFTCEDIMFLRESSPSISLV